MKIYPDAHYIYFRKQLSLDDIPLSYVYNEEQDRIMHVTVNPEFNKPYQETPVFPYQAFSTNDILFFNQNGKPVNNGMQYLQENGNGYELRPQNAETYTPKEFSFDLLLQREDTFKKSMLYRLTFGIKDPDEEMHERIANATQRKENKKGYPSNIIINDGYEEIQKYDNISDNDCDILFIPLTEYKKEDVISNLDENVNLWIYDTGLNGLVEPDDTDIYKLLEPVLYTSATGELPEYKTMFQKEDSEETEEKHIHIQENTLPDFLDETYQEIFFFEIGSPLRIFYKPNGRYVVISHTEFLKNLSIENLSQLRLFMETVMYVYLHSYCKTDPVTTFITDETINYFIDMAQRYYLPHPRINLDRLLLENGENPAIGHTILQCNTHSDTDLFSVAFKGTNRFHDLIFEKTDIKVKDPASGNNVLVYTTKDKILFCDTEFAGLRCIETGIRIREIDTYTIGISATKSSAYQIYTEEEQIISLPKAVKYTICYDKSQSKFVAIETTDPVESSYVPVATVNISQNENIQYQDIRQLGGGESSEIPNYEMIDTGNILGRPYRYGCPMIIRIPSRFKEMQDEIRSEVEKHISSGEYPIILYKD